MTAFEFLELVRSHNATKPGTHDLESGLSTQEWDAWQNAHPGICLPVELVSVLQQCNGFRLVPEPDTPIGAVRLLPLREIEYAPRLLYGGTTSCDDKYPQSVFALTDDPDSAQHLLIDTDTGLFFDVSPIVGIEDDGLVGDNWCSALDWIAKRADLFRHHR